ncbi:hypothetical protein D3C86_1135240 [compost metagenome]
MDARKQQKCGTCIYFRANEKVKWALPDGRVETEALDPIWRNDGACVANPLIRPMPEAWRYDDMRRLRTFWISKRRGKSCPRWDDGGRELTTVELEQEVAIALEKAAEGLDVSASALVMRLLEGKKLWRRSALKRRAVRDEDEQAGDDSGNVWRATDAEEELNETRTGIKQRKRRNRAPIPMSDGSHCLGTGSSWVSGCKEWKAAMLKKAPDGRLELILDHFVSGSSEPIYQKILSGDEKVILMGVLQAYGRIPNFVEEAFEPIGKPLELIPESVTSGTGTSRPAAVTKGSKGRKRGRSPILEEDNSIETMADNADRESLDAASSKTRSGRKIRKRGNRVPTLTLDGGLCLGTGSTWEYRCKEWKEATLFLKPEGHLELVLEHYINEVQEPVFHKAISGDEGTILAEVEQLYGAIPDFVEDAFELVNHPPDLSESEGGRSSTITFTEAFVATLAPPGGANPGNGKNRQGKSPKLLLPEA